MQNPPSRPPLNTPRGLSADLIFLFVFLFIGGILFVVFVFGLFVIGEITTPPTATAALSGPLASPLPATQTPTVAVPPSRTPTPVVLVSPTVWLTNFPSLTPLKSKTATLVVLRTNTPVKTKTKTPVPVSATPSRTRTATITSTPPTATATPTVTTTATLTLTVSSTSTPTETATGTVTATATVTGTATVTATPTLTATATMTPVVVCASSAPSGLLASADTWLDSANPAAVHGSDADLPIRVSGGAQRLLVRFDTSTLTGKTLTEATLYLYLSATDPGVTIFVHRLSTAFDESLASWEMASGSAWAAPGGDFDPVPLVSFQTAGNCLVPLELTSLVQAWADAPASNQGLILVAVGPEGATARLSARDNLNGKGPLLVVTLSP